MQTTLQNSKALHLMRAKALELFYKNGYYNTSIDDIVQNLSITKEVFEHNFQSKEDFFISITQNLILQRTLDMLIEPVTYKQSPFPLILDMFQSDLGKVEDDDNDKGFIVSNFITEFNKRNTKINKYLVDILKIWEINLISLLRKGQMDGYVNQYVDCEGAANHIITSYIGVRTLMAEGKARLLKQQYLQQLRYYFHSIAQKEVA